MAFISDGYHPPTNVKLYLDFGTAYIRAGIELPNGDLRPLEFNGQNALPAYIRLAPLQSRTALDSEVFVGYNARELSNTSTAHIVFYPTLLLRGDLDEAKGTWKTNYPDMMPFYPYYCGSSRHCKVQAAENIGVGVVELMREFIKGIREACQEQISPEYHLADCAVSAHDVTQIEDELLQAFDNTGFRSVAFRLRRDAEIAGLVQHFPNLRQQKPYIVIVRMGAAFSTLFIRPMGGQGAGTTQPAYFGGNDIDELLLKYCIMKFQETYSLSHIEYTRDNIHRLRLNCETVKIQLSTAKQVTLRVPQFYEGRDLAVDLTSDIFREIIGNACYTVLKEFVGTVDQYFSRLEGQKGYALILLGGTTKIPLIQEMITWTMCKPNQQVRSITDTLVIRGMHSLKQTEVTMPLLPPRAARLAIGIASAAGAPNLRTTNYEQRSGMGSMPYDTNRQTTPVTSTKTLSGNYNLQRTWTNRFCTLFSGGNPTPANLPMPHQTSRSPGAPSAMTALTVNPLPQREAYQAPPVPSRTTSLTVNSMTTNETSRQHGGRCETTTLTANSSVPKESTGIITNPNRASMPTANVSASNETSRQYGGRNETTPLTANAAVPKESTGIITNSNRASIPTTNISASNEANRQDGGGAQRSTMPVTVSAPKEGYSLSTDSHKTTSTGNLLEPNETSGQHSRTETTTSIATSMAPAEGSGITTKSSRKTSSTRNVLTPMETNRQRSGCNERTTSPAGQLTQNEWTRVSADLNRVSKSVTNSLELHKTGQLDKSKEKTTQSARHSSGGKLALIVNDTNHRGRVSANSNVDTQSKLPGVNGAPGTISKSGMPQNREETPKTTQTPLLNEHTGSILQEPCDGSRSTGDSFAAPQTKPLHEAPLQGGSSAGLSGSCVQSPAPSGSGTIEDTLASTSKAWRTEMREQEEQPASIQVADVRLAALSPEEVARNDHRMNGAAFYTDV